jgi:hypothetical protein
MNRVVSLRHHSVRVVIAAIFFASGGLLCAAREAAAETVLPRLPTLGPDLVGSWDGLLQMGSGTMPLSFAITAVDGKTSISVDILEQNARDIPVNAAARDGAKLHFDVSALDGSFDGALMSDGTGIQGTWMQVGKRIPLVLKRRTAE